MTEEKKALLLKLREKLGSERGEIEKREFLVCDTVQTGVPKGVICEVIGSARTEWTLRVIQQNPHLNTFWAEERLTLLPTALHQRGIDLRRILIAETESKLFQATRKALKSRLFDCIVLPGTIGEVKMLKALQLFVKESGACVFFLSKFQSNAWAIPFQVEAEWEKGSNLISVNVVKTKFSQVRER